RGGEAWRARHVVPRARRTAPCRWCVPAAGGAVDGDSSPVEGELRSAGRIQPWTDVCRVLGPEAASKNFLSTGSSSRPRRVKSPSPLGRGVRRGSVAPRKRGSGRAVAAGCAVPLPWHDASPVGERGSLIGVHFPI